MGTDQISTFFDDLISRQLAERHIPGAVVVVRDGNILFEQGYGYANLEKQIKVDPDISLFRLTSIYNIADWQPRLDYSVNGNQGVLLVDHSGDDIPVGGELVNEWNLSLNDFVPIDLEVHTGAGETELNLRDLNLTALQVETGAGNANIDLSDALDHDLNAAISGGVGDLSVKLPGEMGVRVSVDTAIGGLTNTGLVKEGEYYVNDAYGSSPNTLYLDITAGVGSISLLAP